MKKIIKNIFIVLIMLGLFSTSLVTCQNSDDKNQYYVSLMYFKDGGEHSRQKFQVKNKQLLKKHKIQEVRSIDVTGSFEIHGINEFIAQPNQIVVYSGNKIDFERYNEDMRMNVIHSILKKGYEKYLYLWGDMKSEALNNTKSTNESTKIFNVAFVTVKDGREADMTLFKEKLKALSHKYGLGSTHTISKVKKGALLGENLIETPTSIDIWYFDTNNNNGGIEGYLKDSKYIDIAPIRLNATSIWGSFQGAPQK